MEPLKKAPTADQAKKEAETVHHNVTETVSQNPNTMYSSPTDEYYKARFKNMSPNEISQEAYGRYVNNM